MFVVAAATAEKAEAVTHLQTGAEKLAAGRLPGSPARTASHNTPVA